MIEQSPPSTPQIELLYNADCPICNWEINQYKKHAPNHLRFIPITDEAAADWGVNPDSALRALHLRVTGNPELHQTGVTAFLVLWQAMPRTRWMAHLVATWPLRVVVDLVYRKLAAPTLYYLHKRRSAKQGGRP
ncbi:MAG: thiol-disulfide oxidoreductase DCC family protein [Paracoccaceae bacterium]